MGYWKTREQLEDNCQTIIIIKMSKIFYLIAVKVGSGLKRKKKYQTHISKPSVKNITGGFVCF